jgi:hypothetical protein
MNLVLWVVQGLLAFAMGASGALKVVTPRAKLAEKMKWAASWTDGRVKLLGLAEVLGAIGLIVPWATGILPILTPVAAACLLVIMIGAVKVHIDLEEPFAPAAVLAVLTALVAFGRSGVM